MRIAVIGAGNVGRAVGERWLAKGHQVVYGVRDPGKSGDRQRFRTVGSAAAESEVVLLSVMFHAVEAALKDCGDLHGKTLIDPTNPLAPDEGGLKLSLGFTTSSAEFIAERTDAKVVKSLNQVGAAVLGNAEAYATRPLQFVAGDDVQAKATVRGLVEQLGFEVLDAGPLRAARLLEPFAMVWIDQSMRHGMDPTRAWAFVNSRRTAG